MARVNAADAERLGVAKGDRVRLTTSVASIELPAVISRDVVEGAVCVPHGYGHDPESSWTIDAPEGERAIAIDPVLRLSSLVMIRDAVRLGAGVARLPLSLVSRDIAGGRLVAWGDVPTARIALWALYPSRRLLNARVSAFLEYLRQSFPNGTAEELAAYLDDRC